MERNQSGQFIKGTNGNTFEGFGVWLDAKGYPCIWLDNHSVRIHVMVWERENGPKPKGFAIHHKDRDKANFALGNLELVSESDHRKIHAGWIREEQTWIAKPCNHCKRILSLEEFYPRKGHTPSALCRPCTNIVTAQHNKAVPEKRRIYNQRWYAKRKGVMPNA